MGHMARLVIWLDWVNDMSMLSKQVKDFIIFYMTKAYLIALSQ